MKFDRANFVDQLVWQMRLADLPRDENRAILQRLFNGDPPFNETEAEENDVQINRNDLTGVSLLTQARRQWTQAMLKPGNYFSIAYDTGPPHKRREWGHSVTRNINRVLKKSRAYMEQSRATGAGTYLWGTGPTTWRTRRGMVPREVPISSVMIPSETELNFENLPYLALFNEMTPAQFYSMTHGSRVDPGWNMPLVKAQLRYVGEQTMKQPNATAFQYMPTRIEELIKQDMGFWGSDAVPTIDYWDFYFKEKEDGPIYRRIILDWGIASTDFAKVSKQGMPARQADPDGRFGKEDESYGGFLYTSGKRKYADSWDEIIHCQFGDCSAVPPFKYHSIRSLAWMLWGVCDLENRLHCKFSESLFEQMMWFFRVSSDAQLKRLQMADFFHMGVIPTGIDWVKANERFTPDKQLIEMGFSRFKQLMTENAAPFASSIQPEDARKEITATEMMAKLNSTNQMVSGMMTLAYCYEEFKDRETLRRGCIPNSTDMMSKDFRTGCLEDGVPPEMLDVERMIVSRERALGAGNKTMEMAQVQFLQQMRKNLGPDAQRKVDHIAIEAATDDAALAEQLAPDEEKHISNSMHDAQLATDRILRGLPLSERPDMVYEDYIKVWLVDLQELMKPFIGTPNLPTEDQILGWESLAKEVDKFLQTMGENEDEAEKVREYRDGLNKLVNLMKGIAQRMAEKAKAAARQAAKGMGGNGADPAAAAKAQAAIIQAQVKAELAKQSHAQKTAQRQVSFEMKERQDEEKHQNEMRRLNREHNYELLTGAARKLADAAARPNPAFEE